MKKLFLLAVTMVLGIATITAESVDLKTAKMLGQKYVQANFDQNRNADLQLVYTFTNQRGESGLYVFDVDDNGFVIVSADNHIRPILGYSKSNNFHPENMSPECRFYLNSIVAGMEQSKNSTVDPAVASEWQSLNESGRLLSFNGGKGSDYLITSTWNQSPAPYNSMCPADPLGPGGHDYVGCVATAMSQLMRYWGYPEHGQGSNSYICYPRPGYAGHPEYGTLSANFGATTYHWDLMLDKYVNANNYTPEQAEAVATICYHCGVAVNMMYGNDVDEGSGAYSDDVPGAIQNYFLYSNAATIQSYNGNVTWWKNLLKEQFDLGWPVYYSGTDPTPTGGGHAFICDGYDDNDLFHFNWGWGGYQDGFFIVNEIDYYQSMRTIVNFVPTPVYNNTVQAPTNVTATKTSDEAQEATISWTNPTKTLNNQTLSSIDRIVVERDNMVIYTEDNVTPGATMSFVDNDVPCYSTFEYKVYAVNGGYNGKATRVSESFGPTCEWKVVATATEMQGWKGGMIVAYDGAGREITSVTMTGNNPANLPMNLTLGRVSFAWKAGSDPVTLSFKIKDASGTTVYEFPNGSSEDIPAGMFYTGNNGCGNAAPTAVPGELIATKDGDDIILSWTGSDKAVNGYNVYRDGYLFKLAHTNEFVDEAPAHGGHCYYVCVLGEGGESAPSNEACATAGDGCEEGQNLWLEILPNFKPLLTWEAPANSEGLAGYEVWRRTNEEGDYKVISDMGPNKTQYKETKALQDGNWYYYKVFAIYEDGCYAAPIKARYGNEFFVKIYYSVTDVNDAMAGKVTVYPNPAKDNFTVEAEGLQSVMVYNTVGQLVYSQTCEGNAVNINLSNVESGIYMVKVLCNEGETVRKISVIR
ncbi:MAG: C10 family peptidase [Bacteroidales bacterium]|nr:C10 family peptidase [Bacteroidales bacterium]